MHEFHLSGPSADACRRARELRARYLRQLVAAGLRRLAAGLHLPARLAHH